MLIRVEFLYGLQLIPKNTIYNKKERITKYLSDSKKSSAFTTLEVF